MKNTNDNINAKFLSSGCLKGCLFTLVVCMIFCIFMIWKCSHSSLFTTYSKKDITENYDKHEAEIRELINYFRHIVPTGIYVDIEINDAKNIDIFHVISNDINYGGWNIDINSGKADTIFQILNWNKDEIKTLKKKLDEVNCISIDNDFPTRLGFQRSFMSKYFYIVFDYSIADDSSLMEEYDDKCMYIFYRDNVALEYGSGAIGSICFPKKFLE